MAWLGWLGWLGRLACGGGDIARLACVLDVCLRVVRGSAGREYHGQPRSERLGTPSHHHPPTHLPTHLPTHPPTHPPTHHRQAPSVREVTVTPHVSRGRLPTIRGARPAGGEGGWDG